MLLAAIVALAIAVAPVYASGAIPCPCHATADCPCHAGGCDMSTPPSAACHCGPAAVLPPPSNAGSGLTNLRTQWVASHLHRLWGLKTPPPLRPPILV